MQKQEQNTPIRVQGGDRSRDASAAGLTVLTTAVAEARATARSIAGLLEAVTEGGVKIWPDVLKEPARRDLQIFEELLDGIAKGDGDVGGSGNGKAAPSEPRRNTAASSRLVIEDSEDEDGDEDEDEEGDDNVSKPLIELKNDDPFPTVTLIISPPSEGLRQAHLTNLLPNRTIFIAIATTPAGSDIPTSFQETLVKTATCELNAIRQLLKTHLIKLHKIHMLRLTQRKSQPHIQSTHSNNNNNNNNPSSKNTVTTSNNSKITPNRTSIPRIRALHRYNETKDIAQELIGMVADNRGVPVASLYSLPRPKGNTRPGTACGNKRVVVDDTKNVDDINKRKKKKKKENNNHNDGTTRWDGESEEEEDDMEEDGGDFGVGFDD